jgi:beta-phosphoglucomutase-like phosphatase (HAD superfamily)
MSHIQIPTVIQLAHFDMAGTTIDDEVGDQSAEFGGKPLPIMIDGFQYGLVKVGVTASFDDINKHRGAKKLDALYNIITELRPDIASEDERKQMTEQAHNYFIERGVELAGKVQTKAGVLDLYRTLKEGGVYVVAATGFPNQITNALVQNLGWQQNGYVDLLVNANQAGGGRPAPNMINFALRKAGILAVPDTQLEIVHPDFDEGLRVGALTIATLEGTQPLEKITSKGQPHYIVDHTKNIVGLINDGKIVLQSYKD